MSVSRFVLIVAAALAASTGGAQAQNIFELLFGSPRRPPQQAPVPPAPVGPSPSRPVEVPHGPHSPPEAPSANVQPSAPAPPKPVVLKLPSEESVVGRDLKLNGTVGNLKIERSGRSELAARLSLLGTKISQPTESCTVKVADGAPIPLSTQGRQEGLPRYDLPAPSCPVRLDVVEGAVLVTGPAEACTFEALDCRVEPKGLWGPDPASLLPKAPEFEQARGAADRAVRENYRALTQSKPQEVRSIVSEQAAFSAEREVLCRSYAREAAHGFCNTRFSEARALSLASRLGVLPAAQPPSAAVSPRRRGPVEQGAAIPPQ